MAWLTSWLTNVKILSKYCHPNILYSLLWNIGVGLRSFPHPYTTGSGNPDILFRGTVSPSLLPRSYFCSLGFIFPFVLGWKKKKKKPSSISAPTFSLCSGPTGHSCRTHHRKHRDHHHHHLPEPTAGAAPCACCPSNIQTLLGLFWLKHPFTRGLYCKYKPCVSAENM